VSVATAIVMLASEPRLAIVWDEGYTLGREARLRDWFRGLRDPPVFAKTWRPLPPSDELVQQSATPSAPRPEQLDTRTKLLFNRDVLAWFWPFAREEPHGHPPFYALLGLLGDVVAPSLADLARARLGAILLFSLTAGAILWFAWRRWSVWAATLSTGAWVLQPNLFGHGHYASYDGVLASLWVLAILIFAEIVAPQSSPMTAGRRWVLTLVFGMILGCAAATKLTGWFLPLPFLAWAGVYRRADGVKLILIGSCVAMLVMLLMMPPWWTDPLIGVVRFFRSNLSRGETIPIKVLFLGKIYETPTQSLPWYNTLVWTLFVTPVGFLILATVGLWAAVRYWRGDPTGLLIAGHWAFLMILRSMPGTPGPDGGRLFLPPSGGVALLAGRGAWSLVTRWGRMAKVLITAAIIEGAVSVIAMMPVPLAYYSPLVGGLPGATALGMEPTYYWDALNPEA